MKLLLYAIVQAIGSTPIYYKIAGKTRFLSRFVFIDYAAIDYINNGG